MATYAPTPFPDALRPDSLHDSDLFRYQMINRRFAPPKLMEKGELIGDVLKLDDDFGQGLQMVYLKKLLDNFKLSKAEVFEEELAAKGLARQEINRIESVADQTSLTTGSSDRRTEVFSKKSKIVGAVHAGQKNMTILFVICVILLAITVGLAAYFYSQARSLREWNTLLTQDRDLWRDKAVVKQGIGLLGKERATPHKPTNKTPQAKVVTRNELAQRYEDSMKDADADRFEDAKRTSAVNISGNSIVTRAKEILDS